MKNKGEHAGRWKVKRAMRVKSLRQANNDDSNSNSIHNPKTSRADLEVYENAEAQEQGNIGILAEFNPPNYMILYGSKFLSGKAETDYQLDLLDQLVIGDNVIFEL
ncbi:MAG: hypothetical protein QXL94_05090, partial [Candidatus Parvarchaeum sp.]